MDPAFPTTLIFNFLKWPMNSTCNINSLPCLLACSAIVNSTSFALAPMYNYICSCKNDYFSSFIAQFVSSTYITNQQCFAFFSAFSTNQRPAATWKCIWTYVWQQQSYGNGYGYGSGGREQNRLRVRKNCTLLFVQNKTIRSDWVLQTGKDRLVYNLPFKKIDKMSNLWQTGDEFFLHSSAVNVCYQCTVLIKCHFGKSRFSSPC